MLTLRYILRLTVEFINRFKGLMLLSVVGGVGVFLLANILVPSLLGPKAERIGVTGRYRAENLPLFILHMAGDGLTKIGERGEVLPDLASSWETLDKGKTWVFHLQGGRHWQDGESVKSRSVVYEFSDLKLERPDEQTLVFKLPYPFAPFPAVVSRPTFKKGLLGTGDWRVVNVSVNGNFVESVTLQDKTRHTKIYKFYPTEEASKLAYKLGQVDKLTGILDPGPFRDWKNTTISTKTNYNQVVTIFFNTQVKPVGDKSIRQALAYALNKSSSVYPRSLGPISQNSWAYNPQIKSYDYDPTRAKELISGLPKEEKDNLKISLVTSPLLLSQAEVIARDWEAVGVKTAVSVSSGVPTDYQAFLAILDTPDDPDQYGLWHSTQGTTNMSHYSSPRIDKLLEDGRTTVAPEERKRIYLDFQRFLLEDSPAVFLYYPIYFDVQRK